MDANHVKALVESNLTVLDDNTLMTIIDKATAELRRRGVISKAPSNMSPRVQAALIQMSVKDLQESKPIAIEQLMQDIRQAAENGTLKPISNECPLSLSE